MIKLFTLLVGLLLVPFGESDFTQRIPLTEEKVKNYIETRVKTHDLQLEYKVKADQYDDVIVAYYKARNERLTSQGWTAEEFDATEEWILGVVSSIKAQEELEKENADREAQFAEFDANEYLSDEQKQQMKDALLESVVQRQAYIDIFKEDWPAVRPYLEQLDQLDKYIGGSRTEPPTFQ